MRPVGIFLILELLKTRDFYEYKYYIEILTVSA